LPPIINAQGISKTFGAVPLFESISFTISENERIGLIGPNGSGKSTLLRILAGLMESDSGEVAFRKRARMSYVEQESNFPDDATVRSVLLEAMRSAGVPEPEHAATLAETLGRAGFEDFDRPASALSGGWKKRLSIAAALVQKPGVLLLDEPTNHLDLEGIEWLEELLERSSFACVVVSHDRYFLENVANEIFELDRAYPTGFLRVDGKYSTFLEQKEAFLHALTNRREALENRVRTEIDWLRRGPKARTTKSKARIDNANKLIGQLADLRSRSTTNSANIDFSATDRKTKRLVELENVSYGYGERTLFSDLDFVLTAGTRVGLVGPNGSGKTTLLRLLTGQNQPQSGTIKQAPNLRIVYFDQTRQLDLNVTLRRALAPDSDSVIYQDRVIHVASWAARFLFNSEQLDQPVSKLSGGERARVLIAKLMLQPAEILLLDEPTNDLDITTLDVLEESLLEFTGALVLVTHDRYMLDKVSTVVLGLDGLGHIERFADYAQWEQWIEQQRRTEEQPKSATEAVPKPQLAAKKKLSYMEAREYSTIEERIAQAEKSLASRQSALEDPAIQTDSTRLITAQHELEQAQAEVDRLVERWAELEEKQSQ
jgi:ABC transport system ATP-binding/permease protein